MAAGKDPTSSTEQLIKDLSAIDRLAEDILTDRHEIVDLDAKRNKCREATRRIQEQFTDVSKTSRKTWVCFGNTFIKMDTQECLAMLETDRKTIDKEINTLRDGLKPKVAQLHEMEGRPEVKGFQLTALTPDELIFTNQK